MKMWEILARVAYSSAVIRPALETPLNTETPFLCPTHASFFPVTTVGGVECWWLRSG